MRIVLPPESDAGLVSRVRLLTGGRTGRLAVAVVDMEPVPRARYATIGAEAGTIFEIGSITKALTGMLLADAVQRNELRLDTRVGDVAPAVEGTDLASVTLLELATHTSGLPRMPRGPTNPARVLSYALLGRNPYRGSPPHLVEVAAGQSLDGRGRRRYSNLGGAVLGELVAAAAAGPFSSLLEERILAPLEMGSSAVSAQGTTAPRGRSSLGLPREPWVLGSYAPAGGAYSTIGDLVRLAGALLDGSAPGVAAVEPIDGVPTDRPDRRSGLFWIVDGPSGQSPALTWHNGGTGGYSSFVALAPTTRRAVIALEPMAGRSRRLQHIATELVR